MLLEALHTDPTEDDIQRVSKAGYDPLMSWTEDQVLAAFDGSIKRYAWYLYRKYNTRYKRNDIDIYDVFQSGRIGALDFIRKRKPGKNYRHMVLRYAQNEMQRGGRIEDSPPGTPKDYLGLMPWHRDEWAAPGKEYKDSKSLFPKPDLSDVDVVDPDVRSFIDQLSLEDREELDRQIADANLNPRERNILSVMLDGYTSLAGLADEFGISPPRMNQIFGGIANKLGIDRSKLRHKKREKK